MRSSTALWAPWNHPAGSRCIAPGHVSSTPCSPGPSTTSGSAPSQMACPWMDSGAPGLRQWLLKHPTPQGSLNCHNCPSGKASEEHQGRRLTTKEQEDRVWWKLREMAPGRLGTKEPTARAQLCEAYLQDLIHPTNYKLPPCSCGLALSAWSSLALSCPGEIGLRCFTSDLQWVQCEWTWDSADSNSSHSLFYRSQGSSDASRGQAWQRCQEHRVKPQNTHACTFQPRNDSDIFILVNISRGHPEPALSYFREPFRMHQAVLTSPPRILQANISGGQLRLQWAPPEEELAEYMVYQIRYSVENSLDWKVLQIQHAANSETLDLRAGPCYLLQVRAKPNGQQLQGFWSAWSETIVVEAPSGAGSKDTGEPDAFTASFSVPGWIILSLTITLFFFVGLLGLRCSFPSAYSSVKRKLWPPAPDLHRVLGTFLTDSKQQQASTSFYNKPLEDVILPCLLEVLSERKGAETPPEPTLLKTACPGSGIPEGPEDEDASNLSSPHQDYMVLHPSSPTGSRYENEYLDNRGEGDDIYLRGLAVLLLHVPDAHSELRQDRAEIQYNPQVPSCLQAEHVPLGGPVDSEEEDWECPCSGKQSMSTTDISNQSYLLMRSWEQQPFL
ncbi:thrombopoietin receptor isoform X4 [Gopherus evgoodei]|uniref:thrombopoietin receptor isoform X4 n=1 Tax=Gopherus evgoodei TaxID=1825980 RepID=UPI0011CF3D7A|nr:thrombopoietin receptor isoform X4 [Gopherus evgoodei]